MRLITCALVLVFPLVAQPPKPAVRVAATLPGGANTYYTGNRAPLLPSPLMKLPLGSVRARGWLRRQLELMGGGFVGHLSEISSFCKFDNNAWAHPKGEGPNGWEELPYWLRGFYNLGVQLNDPRIQKEARRWLDAVIASRQPGGWFGSRGNLEGGRSGGAASHAWPGMLAGSVPDLWPNMVMLYPLRSLYEATGDKRVLDLMLKYFRWQAALPLEHFHPVSWQHWRAGDNLDSIYWLYNRTGESWLLELARANHERTADWVGGVPTWHVVNIAECFREPAQYYQQTKDPRYLRVTERAYDTIRAAYGQTPGGMYGADENARPGFDGPRQGTETCAFVEMLYSDEMLLSITGDPKWADRAEEIAFNSLPCSMTPDLKGLHYLTAPNQVQLDAGNKAPLIENGGDMFSYNPHQYRCCQHNVAFGWPYYAEYSWMATPRNGLAAVFYVAGEVSAKVGDGTTVRVKEVTDYPFDETVQFTVSAPKPVRFPLSLRLPAWTERPALSVNGARVEIGKTARGWVTIEREWTEGDKVRLELPMPVRTTVWTKNRGTMSVHRGPLTYSLRIGERWEKKGGTPEWPGAEVYPTTPWNYGLVVDSARPASSFTLVRRKDALPAQPFALDAPPIVLRAQGRRIPEWTQEPNGMVGEVQPGPVRSSQPVEEITLVPMGSARLRITAFPLIGEGAAAREWGPAPPLVFASAAGHFEPIRAVHDGVAPGDAFAWSDRRGSSEWIEYYYTRPKRASAVEVWWANQDKGARRLPESWSVVYWDGRAWQPVSASSGYELRADRFSRVSFTPVETTRIRVMAQMRERYGAGICEMKVLE